jgi:uncharacterized lipoprotein YmbA
MMTFRHRLFPALAPLLLVAACGGTPSARVYVLGDPVAPAQTIEVQSQRPVVRLLPVSVPDYLDTREILRRDRSNELTASPTGLWADRLSVGMTQALAGFLTADLRGVVVVTGQPDAPPARQIMVDVLGFEIGPDGRCILNARWETVSGDGGKLLRRENDSFVEQAAKSSDGSVVAAMTRAIDRLALQIVAASRNLEVANAEGDNDTAAHRRLGFYTSQR